MKIAYWDHGLKQDVKSLMLMHFANYAFVMEMHLPSITLLGRRVMIQGFHAMGTEQIMEIGLALLTYTSMKTY